MMRDGDVKSARETRERGQRHGRQKLRQPNRLCGGSDVRHDSVSTTDIGIPLKALAEISVMISTA